MTKIALLVGVSEYDTPGLSELPAAKRGIDKLRDVFSINEKGDFDEITCLSNPFSQELLEAIEYLFSNRNKEDTLLLYYAGHGIKDEKGKLFLAAKNTRKDIKGSILKSTAISSSFIHEMMNSTRSKKQVLILDCCFSGAFAEGLIARSDDSIDIKSQLFGEGRAVLTSSTSTQYSFEKQNEEFSVYTSYLIRGLETQEADINKDGWITADELHSYVKSKVQEVEPSMKPEIYAIKEGYKIPIARVLSKKREPSFRSWGDKPICHKFYGRTQEVISLKKLILEEKCRLITILGMGGIGKSTLVSMLTKQIGSEFDYSVWYSLREAPPFQKVVSDIVKFISNQETISLPDAVGGKVNKLLQLLKAAKCLIVFDNVESILDTDISTGSYQSGYESYGEIFQRVGAFEHKSCLLLTSRERPVNLELIKARSYHYSREFYLRGLEEDSRYIIEESELQGSDAEKIQLSNLYGGNPLALNIACHSIRQIFGGDLSQFLKDGSTAFGGIRTVLDEQFSRLSDIEEAIIYWLAVFREPVTLSELQNNFLPQLAKSRLVEYIASLVARSLVEPSERGCFTLQNVVMEYVTERFIDHVYREIGHEDIQISNTHAIMLAKAKEYVREIQIRKIVLPLAEKLLSGNSRIFLEAKLLNILVKWKKDAPLLPGYLGGNVLNIIMQFNSEISNYDLSYLTIWHACFQSTKLLNVDLSFCDLSDSTFAEIFGNILSLCYSPDGLTLTAGNDNGELCIWNADEGTPKNIFKAHESQIRAVSFCGDGGFFVTSGDDFCIKVWNSSTNVCTKILKGHSGQVRSIATTFDGKFLVSGSDDRSIRVWDLSTGQCLHELRGHDDRVWSVDISPNGQTLVSASDDYTICFWDLLSGNCIARLKASNSWIRSVVFHPKEQFLASSGEDKKVKLWDLESYEVVYVFSGHISRVRAMRFSPDGNILASCGDDATVRIWDIKSGHPLLVLQGHSGRVRSLAFSPSGKVLASSGDDRSIILWDVTTGEKLKTFQSHANWLWSLSFSFDGCTLATSGEDQVIRIWDVNAFQPIKTFPKSTGRIRSLSFSPDGKTLISDGEDRSVHVWNVDTSRYLGDLPGHAGRVRSVIFSPDSQFFASCSDDKTVRLWDANTKVCIKEFVAHTDWVWDIDFSLSGNLLISAGDDQSVKVWDVYSGKCLSTLEGFSAPIRAVSICSNEKVIAVSGEKEEIFLWDIKTSKIINKLRGHNNSIWSLSFHPSRGILASASYDQTVRLWEVRTGKNLMTLCGHTNWVRSVSFSPDGEMLASCSQDETVKLWSIETGECLQTLRSPRPYEGTNISNAIGLSEASRNTLVSLGASDHSQ